MNKRSGARIRENLQGFGSADPDDLAAVLCASLVMSGYLPRIVMCPDATKRIVAIEIHCDGKLVASLPTHPMTADALQCATLAAGIEACGALTAAKLRNLSNDGGSR